MAGVRGFPTGSALRAPCDPLDERNLERVAPQYSSPNTYWRGLRAWEDADVFLNVWQAFRGQLDDRQKIRCDERFADGSFAPAKKGAIESLRPNAAKARSKWFWSKARVPSQEHT